MNIKVIDGETLALMIMDAPPKEADDYAHTQYDRVRRLAFAYNDLVNEIVNNGEPADLLMIVEGLKEQAKEVVAQSTDSVGPGETGTFAAKMIQPEDDPRFQGGTILGRNAGWE